MPSPAICCQLPFALDSLPRDSLFLPNHSDSRVSLPNATHDTVVGTHYTSPKVITHHFSYLPFIIFKNMYYLHFIIFNHFRTWFLILYILSVRKGS